jgi:tetratricopeptide (TPR) repeat protein
MNQFNPSLQDRKLMIRHVSNLVKPCAKKTGAGLNISRVAHSPDNSVGRGILVAFVLLLAVLAKHPYAQLIQQAVPSAGLFRTSDTLEAEMRIRFLEDRIKHDPEDFVSYNSLASSYLQRLRETGDLQLLTFASRAAQKSLEIVPVVRNPGGLAALAQTEIAGHEFVSARDHALQLTGLSSGDQAYALLADSSLELGDYEAATNAVQTMERIDGGSNDATAIRRARLAFLMGKVPTSRVSMANAIVFLLNRPTPPVEALAWCYWQLGETDFASGKYEDAEKDYRRSLAAFPGYFRAIAGLARTRAARGDVPDAIKQYKLAVSVFPDPTFVAALGDLYKLSGRDRDAKEQYELVEYIARLSELSGVVYNRQLALFYADHGLSAAKAYAAAQQEFVARRDIYGADAVAWTALKAGKTEEAQTAIHQALRLGTQDARLFYHAGLIAQAAGDRHAAQQYLQKAKQLNPEFDALQKTQMARALSELRPNLR